MEEFIMNLRHVLISKLQFLLITVLTIGAVSESNANEKILLAVNKGVAFEEVLKGIEDDLEGEFELEKLIVSKSSKPTDIGGAIKRSSPKLVVLIGNQPTKLYAKFQKSNPSINYPPSLIIAALFADKLVKKIKNATAIRYEIPAVTSMVNLRSVLSSKVKKVGVIYRAWMSDLVDQNERFLKSEGIQLVRFMIQKKEKNIPKAIKKGLKTFSKENVQALWVVTDNALLNVKALTKAWVPALSKSKMAVVVNVESLVKTKLKFGNFSVYPDHYGLGVQGANAIFEIQDEDWSIDDRDIEEPLSVKKLLNMTMTKKKGLSINQKGLNTIDKIIE